MLRLLITGEGFPAFTVLKAAYDMPGVAVSAFVSGSSASVKADMFAKQHGIRSISRAVLLGTEPVPADVEADWLVNINGTTIIAADVIARFADRSLNLHPGMLPQYAGLHCHQWAIRNGESVQGMTVHVMDTGLDTGAIVAQRTLPILGTDTGFTLFKKTMEQGAQLLVEVLARIAAKDMPDRLPQDLSRRVLYRHKDALNGEIDWNWSARKIRDFVRAANYAPFTCPTYTPNALFSGERLVLRKCEIASFQGSAMNGTLILDPLSGPVVVCGTQEAIVIKQALHNGRTVEAPMWRVFAGIDEC